MKKMEVINIRLGEPADHGKLLALLRQMRPETNATEVRLYRNAEFAGDWAIHLHHPECQPGANGKSLLAFCMVDLFQSIGLVHHSVWFPESP